MGIGVAFANPAGPLGRDETPTLAAAVCPAGSVRGW